jgi:hypothetical protein
MKLFVLILSVHISARALASVIGVDSMVREGVSEVGLSLWAPEGRWSPHLNERVVGLGRCDLL